MQTWKNPAAKKDLVIWSKGPKATKTGPCDQVVSSAAVWKVKNKLHLIHLGQHG